VKASKPKPKAKAKPAPKVYAARADLGKPVEGFFAKQPPHLRPILDELRAVIERAAPDATSAIKWGNAMYSVGGVMTCGLTAHKAHVNLILAGPPGTFDDPDGRLTGTGKTGRHLKLTSLEDLPRTAVRLWIAQAVAAARAKA
jgi:hypothetical protein